jgi:hypothetical protein
MNAPMKILSACAVVVSALVSCGKADQETAGMMSDIDSGSVRATTPADTSRRPLPNEQSARNTAMLADDSLHAGAPADTTKVQPLPDERRVR